ncbi:alpha/beta-hydrolase family protein [Tomitella cavernea]|uniref:Alpha/beta-hydrolase family protein n=1 Tax=Tomitella cavernea TaxID=1387982 RepID=A0ABP9CUP7_9ACTN|nr:alpha/beta-hydrolase family protein [Tomitella cavernea]
MTAAPALHVLTPGAVARSPLPRGAGTRVSALAHALAPRTRTVVGGSAGAVAGVYPGIMPRSVWVEGVTVGAFAVIGVALTVLMTWLWARATRRLGGSPGRSRSAIATAVGCLGAVTAAAAWSAQSDRVSELSASGGYRPAVFAVAVAVCATALGAVRLVRARPRAVAALAVVLAALGSVSGAVALDEPPAAASSLAATAMSTRSGGPGSLVAWDSLGGHGRRFVGDTAHPGAIRTYAGLGSAADVTARAALAADDMVRAGGLDRRAVVVMVPTGSGWIDGTAAAGFEEFFGGDVAEVGMQYSSAPSWVSYLFAPDEAASAAHALISAVAARVSSVPAPRRPELYVYGESMGAAAGARALADAPQARGMLCGALWVGPPARFTDPVPGRSSVVVNASDPVPRWDPALALHPAEGAAEAAAPPWVPGVSFLQRSVDVVVSRSGPAGTGHVYGGGQVRGLPTCS